MFVNIKKLVLKAFLFFSLFSIVFAQTAQAASSLNTGERITLNKDQTIDGDYFAAGESITLAGTVNGDAYIAGGNINIEGTINGDLLVAGGNINIRGIVTGDVRGAGGNISVEGSVGKNATILGGDIIFSEASRIAGSLVGGGGNYQIFAPIAKDITLGAGQLTLGNSVGGDINTGVGELTLTPSATVSGTINYWSDTEARIDQGASVSGTVNRFSPPADKNQGAKEAASEFISFYRIASFLTALILGLLLLRFFPIFTQRTGEVILQRPVLSFGVGILTLILTPVIFILLIITVLGIPLAFIYIFSLMLMIYFGKIFIGVALGIKTMQLLGQKSGIYWTFIVGLVVYVLLTSLPFVGWLLTLILVLMGFGGQILERKEMYQTLREKKII